MEDCIKKLLIVLIVFLSDYSSADFQALRSGEEFNYLQFYQVAENFESSSSSLLTMLQVEKKFPKPTVPYHRLNHFGGWLRDDAKCINTRAEVLRRESRVSVTYSESGCSVQSGEWFDGYTNKLFTKAEDIQIDHFVPLKNAYMSGAHEWSSKKRCLYANYMGNKFHLLPISSKENLKKSDHAPNEYVPPNGTYICQYLVQWLKVKLIWSLRMTPPEAKAILAKALQAKCDPADFVMTNDELSAERRYMKDHENLCANRH